MAGAEEPPADEAEEQPAARRSDSDLGESLTPRVAAALMEATRVPDEDDGELQQTLPLEAFKSWDAVQALLKKLSLAKLDYLLQPSGQKPAPGSGIAGRVDLVTEYLKQLTRKTRANIREENWIAEQKRKAEIAKANRELDAALKIQSWWRGRVPRQKFLDYLRATADFRNRGKMAAAIAKKWQRVGPPPDSAVIWLHGRGECEASWQGLLRGLTGGACRWVWPRAPAQGSGGLRQWFDIPELPVCAVVRGVPDRPRREESALQLAAAVERVHLVIASLEAEGVPTDRVVLGGFGQGAALAAHAGLRYPRALAGVALVSAWLPCMEELADRATAEGKANPFLWCHGAGDAVVLAPVALAHAKWLQELGVHVDFSLFPALRFGLDGEVTTVLRKWLAERLVARRQPDDAE